MKEDLKKVSNMVEFIFVSLLVSYGNGLQVLSNKYSFFVKIYANNLIDNLQPIKKRNVCHPIGYHLAGPGTSMVQGFFIFF